MSASEVEGKVPRLLNTRRLGVAAASVVAAGAAAAVAAPAATAFSGWGTPCSPKYVKPATDCVHGTGHRDYHNVSGWNYSGGGVCAGLYSVPGAATYTCTATGSGGSRTYLTDCRGTNPGSPCYVAGSDPGTDVHNHFPGGYKYDFLWING